MAAKKKSMKARKAAKGKNGCLKQNGKLKKGWKRVKGRKGFCQPVPPKKKATKKGGKKRASKKKMSYADALMLIDPTGSGSKRPKPEPFVYGGGYI